MLNIEEWMKGYMKRLLDEFQDRIIFIGLQGSYGRGEATEDSDIDVVAIFDFVTIEDLRKYDTIISELSERDKICGFVSGKGEIMHWEKSDLFQFYYDTQACYGDMDFILPLLQKDHARQAVLIGSCNIYHACCHNIIHEKSKEILPAHRARAVSGMPGPPPRLRPGRRRRPRLSSRPAARRGRTGKGARARPAWWWAARARATRPSPSRSAGCSAAPRSSSSLPWPS